MKRSKMIRFGRDQGYLRVRLCREGVTLALSGFYDGTETTVELTSGQLHKVINCLDDAWEDLCYLAREANQK